MVPLMPRSTSDRYSAADMPSSSAKTSNECSPTHGDGLSRRSSGPLNRQGAPGSQDSPTSGCSTDWMNPLDT